MPCPLNKIRIPMVPDGRSMNLSNAVSVDWCMKPGASWGIRGAVLRDKDAVGQIRRSRRIRHDQMSDPSPYSKRMVNAVEMLIHIH